LGSLREKQTDYSQAMELYLLADKEGERDGISLNNVAWITALKDHNFKEALNYVNQALARKHDQADFLDTRGVVYLKAGNRERALDDLLRAVEIDP
jgi:tetratricopeptide (TPR) repeat protein